MRTAKLEPAKRGPLIALGGGIETAAACLAALAGYSAFRPARFDTLAQFTRRAAPLLVKIEDKEPRFGHFLYGVTQAFTSHAGVLYAPVRHIIDAKG